MENPIAKLYSHFIPRPSEPFDAGYSKITEAGDAEVGGLDTRIDFGIRIQNAGETIVVSDPKESVWVLLRGDVRVSAGGERASLKRGSIFDEAPSGIHVGPDTELTIETLGGEAEWAVSRTDNDKQLKVRIFTPDTLSPEYRGAGQVQDACRRNVRLIFDYDNNPESNLVIGEVVNYPGRWSSYPPHHHDQP
ncbi:MAG: 5-deoxy-glucuronate isomerase, partial [Opitutales bacterium]|nr:5-deoxy-glucuronate isomerase [Opitutales bacterium]